MQKIEMDDIEKVAQRIRAARVELREREQALNDETQAFLSSLPDSMVIREKARLVGLSTGRISQLQPGLNRRGRRARPEPTA